MTTPELLTVTEVAERLRVHRMTVYRLTRTNKLEHLKVNRTIRIRAQALEAFIQANTSTQPK